MSELVLGGLFWLCIAVLAFCGMVREEGWIATIKAFACYGVWLLGVFALVLIAAIGMGGVLHFLGLS